MVKKPQKLDYLFFISALRELCENYIEDPDYDYFDEMISVQASELLEQIENEPYDNKYQSEIDFYLKYSGYDDSDFLDKFSSSSESQLVNDNDDYSASDWIDTQKFYKNLKKEFEKLKKEEINNWP
jgi:hypothetical protein